MILNEMPLLNYHFSFTSNYIGRKKKRNISSNAYSIK